MYLMHVHPVLIAKLITYRTYCNNADDTISFSCSSSKDQYKGNSGQHCEFPPFIYAPNSVDAGNFVCSGVPSLTSVVCLGAWCHG